MDVIDLLHIRKQAGLTQEQVADALKLSQSQVSRYEADPEDVPVKIVRAWAALCGDVQKTAGFSLPDNKRQPLDDALQSVYGWFKYAPSITGDGLPNLTQMLESIKVIGRKPRIAVAGKFDAGKSTLLNYLLGGKALPASFQPTTSLLCQIKHISDKPVWQTEPAALFKAGYDINDPANKENFDNHKLFVGDTSILQKYAQHTDRLIDDEKPVVAVPDAMYAVIYLDSPILTAVDLIDLPGYGNDQKDTEKAEIAQYIADALIYLSPYSGFLGSEDLLYLPVLMDKLTPIVVDGKTETLANLFVVCTHIHSIVPDTQATRKEVLDEILDKSVKRIGPALEGAMKTASARWEAKIDTAVVRKRMFGFAVDANAAEIRAEFLNELSRYAGDVMPRFTLENLIKVMTVAKGKELTAISGLIKQLSQSLEDRAAAEKDVKEMREKKDITKTRFKSEFNRLSLLIDECLGKSKIATKTKYDKFVNVPYIENLIRTSYNDKKDAQKYVSNIILDRFKREVNEEVSVISSKFNDDLNGVLDTLSNATSPAGSTLSFDAKSAFLSALAGMSATGALAGWAAVVAGGSNLGGYILAAKIVGWLTALGIPVGGPTVVMSTIAALGGPVMVAVGLGTLLAGGLYALFGADWQTRLARKLVEQFKDQEVLSTFDKSIKQYWVDTKVALEQSMDETLQAYEKFIQDRAEILSLDKNAVLKRIDDAKQVEAFFRMEPKLPASL